MNRRRLFFIFGILLLPLTILVVSKSMHPNFAAKRTNTAGDPVTADKIQNLQKQLDGFEETNELLEKQGNISHLVERYREFWNNPSPNDLGEVNEITSILRSHDFSYEDWEFLRKIHVRSNETKRATALLSLQRQKQAVEAKRLKDRVESVNHLIQLANNLTETENTIDAQFTLNPFGSKRKRYREAWKKYNEQIAALQSHATTIGLEGIDLIENFEVRTKFIAAMQKPLAALEKAAELVELGSLSSMEIVERMANLQIQQEEEYKKLRRTN